MTFNEEEIISGFIEKVISDCVDISWDIIKEADKNRESKTQDLQARIYQVIIDAINNMTDNKYMAQDILYNATETMLNGFKYGNKNEIEDVKQGLSVLNVNIDNSVCDKFIEILYTEIRKVNNFDVYREILLILQEQKSRFAYRELSKIKRQLRRISRNNDDLDVENLIKKISQQYSKKIYKFVIVVLFLLQVFSFFGASNNIERIISILLIILLIGFSKLSGKIGKWINNIYICMLLICVIVSTFVQKPFMGIFSDKDNRTKFYDKFAQGFYEYSIGNDQEAIQIYKEIKSYVPDDEILDYYMWYIDAASCAEDMDLVMQLQNEISEKIVSPTAYEAEALYKFIPIALIIYDFNDDNYEGLLQKVLPYQNANEEIFTLFEIWARCHLETGINRRDILESLFLKLQSCEDNFNNYEYIKKNLLELIAQELYISDPDLSIMAMADLYARDHAGFFEEYIWIYPQYYNFANVRWISIDCLQELQIHFRTGWNQMKKSESSLYSVYKKKLLNLGLFLGVTDVMSEIEQKKLEFSKIDSIIASYSEETASVYNILQIEDGQYIFSVFVASSYEVDRVEYYTINLNSQDKAQLVMIDGEPLQESLIMGKLCLLEYTGIPGKYISAIITGTGEGLGLSILDLDKKSFKQLGIKESNYHCGDFLYDMETKTCQWKFEINNSIDANMWTKVGGKVIATINFDEFLLKMQTTYSDPALQFYVEERNEQLIFPLANLNRLDGREIKDESLLEEIRGDCVPYYHHSYIQRTINVWSNAYIPSISAITVSYTSDENALSDLQYFFLVKREGENVKLLGIYKVTEKGLKSVY